jgi:hypothetical protein
MVDTTRHAITISTMMRGGSTMAVLCVGLLVSLNGCASRTSSDLPAGQQTSIQASVVASSPVTGTGTVTSAAGSGSAVAGSATAGPGVTASVSAIRSSTPPPSGSTGTDGVLRLSATDSGRIFSISLGTRVEVSLAPDLGSYHPPTTDNPSVLTETAHRGGYPANTTAVADYTATGRGTTHLASETDLACLHTNPPCLPPQRQFAVTIIIR